MRIRPDLLVRLPGGRTVVVDAKVPLEAYLDAQDATDDHTREAQLADHARQVRDHMTKLGAKAYWEQFQPSPEFVVMFLPGEAIFQAALQNDARLIDFGVGAQVFPSSPLTLIALLRAVAHGWRQERLTRNAEQVSRLGKDLYDRVRYLTDRMETLRGRLDATVRAFNDTVATYEGRVLVTARRFRDLGAATGEDLGAVGEVESTPRSPHGVARLFLAHGAADAPPPAAPAGRAGRAGRRARTRAVTSGDQRPLNGARATLRRQMTHARWRFPCSECSVRPPSPVPACWPRAAARRWSPRPPIRRRRRPPQPAPAPEAMSVTGKPLYPMELPNRTELEANLKKAEDDLAASPDSADALIWVGPPAGLPVALQGRHRHLHQGHRALPRRRRASTAIAAIATSRCATSTAPSPTSRRR